MAMIHPKQTLLRESRCHSTHAFTTVQPRKLSVACRASKQQGSAEVCCVVIGNIGALLFTLQHELQV
jgi:hypothetical protein